MVVLYLSRKIGWTLAIIFFAVAAGLYFYPASARPMVGAAVAIGDQVTNGLLNVVKFILLRI